MAFFAVDDVGAEQWHGRLNHVFSEAAALREVAFGLLNTV